MALQLPTMLSCRPEPKLLRPFQIMSLVMLRSFFGGSNRHERLLGASPPPGLSPTGRPGQSLKSSKCRAFWCPVQKAGNHVWANRKQGPPPPFSPRMFSLFPMLSSKACPWTHCQDAVPCLVRRSSMFSGVGALRVPRASSALFARLV